MAGLTATITAGGRLVLPAKVRSELHLEDGARVVVEVRKGSVVVTPLSAKLRAAQALVTAHAGKASLVDALREERRGEFERESDE